MKKFITNYAVAAVLVAAVLLLIPGIVNRVENEQKNDNIVMSVLYNDIELKVSQDKLNSFLDECKANGIDTVSVRDIDLSYIIAKGGVNCEKYNALLRRYDDESMRLASFVEEKCPDISYDSYVIVTKKEDMKELFKRELPKRYADEEYMYAGTFGDMEVFVLYNGQKPGWEYTLGYDEDIIRGLKEKGFKVALVHKLANRRNTEYLEDVDYLVKKYDIEYLNLKKDTAKLGGDINTANYEGFAEIINDNNMTLVVTENINQLSNEKFIGYPYVYNSVVADGGTHKILRSYETTDDSRADDTFYGHRVEQYFNSTLDRSLRFITVTQIAIPSVSYDECADYTLQAAVEYKDKIEKEGFRVNGETNTIDYRAHRTVISALCMVIMIMSLLLIYHMITGKQSFALSLGGIIAAAGAFAVTAVLPDSLVLLYPTLFCMIESCTAITAVLWFVKQKAAKLNMIALIGGALAIMLSVLVVYSMCLGAMLSGIDYYVNNTIFRGIKLSLVVPVFYTTVVYYLMFMKNDKRSFVKDVSAVMTAEIKVYWLIIAAAVAGVLVYYLIRSGNVTEISTTEATMRHLLTNFFSERPRTKEFLIGYPALVLFVYYVKKTDIELIRWILAVAMSILAASVTNSFCHVFTNFTTIVMRSVNGLIVGLAVSAAVYVLNLVVIKILKAFKNKYDQIRRK